MSDCSMLRPMLIATCIISGILVTSGPSNLFAAEGSIALSDDARPIGTAASSASSPPQGMRLIAAGTFVMGASGAPDEDELPRHQVWIDAFYIDECEVTCGQYNAFVVASGHPKAVARVAGALDDPNRPVTGVTWEDANAYCRWARKRLPTEAEWEKACRGGLVGRTYPWGNDEPRGRAAFGKLLRVGRLPTRVRSFQPNGYGLFDMAGNVAEWCSDWYASDYYKVSATSNPRGPESGTEHVIRGCAFYHESLPWVCSMRWALPSLPYSYVGFRCVMSVEQQGLHIVRPLNATRFLNELPRNRAG